MLFLRFSPRWGAASIHPRHHPLPADRGPVERLRYSFSVLRRDLDEHEPVTQLYSTDPAAIQPDLLGQDSHQVVDGGPILFPDADEHLGDSEESPGLRVRGGVLLPTLQSSNNAAATAAASYRSSSGASVSSARSNDPFSITSRDRSAPRFCGGCRRISGSRQTEWTARRGDALDVGLGRGRSQDDDVAGAQELTKPRRRWWIERDDGLRARDISRCHLDRVVSHHRLPDRSHMTLIEGPDGDRDRIEQFDQLRERSHRRLHGTLNVRTGPAGTMGSASPGALTVSARRA